MSFVNQSLEMGSSGFVVNWTSPCKFLTELFSVVFFPFRQKDITSKEKDPESSQANDDVNEMPLDKTSAKYLYPGKCYVFGNLGTLAN